jgi:hypothetical protein
VSVWGGDDHKLTWNATINGLEGAAALYNDSSTALLAPAEHLPLLVCTPKENEQTESWLLSRALLPPSQPGARLAADLLAQRRAERVSTAGA